jgi:AGCS family alanine or glycine:cation symporter
MGGGLFLLVYSGFVPFRYYLRGIKQLTVKNDNVPGQISSFQALATEISATIGLGSIAGVAIALSIGGPGAIFWMWVSASVGMATKFFEGSLSILYKGRDNRGEVQGGIMYIITEGLGKKWKPLAVFFSVAGLFGTICVMQANQLTETVVTMFITPNGIENTILVRFLIGLGIVAMVSLVIIGGIKRIAKVSTRIAPFMVIVYFSIVMYIIVTHISFLDDVFMSIIRGAFDFRAGLGGMAAVALTGARRAALINEAGIGTSTLMHGASKNDKPIKEGLIAMLGPSLDSGFICTLTALAILLSGVNIHTGNVEGLTIALNAFKAAIPGYGNYFLFIIVIVFAFSTMFSYSYYGEKCTRFLFGADKAKYFKIYFLATIVVFSIVPLRAAVSFIDLAFAFMALPTMFTVLRLSPKVKALMKSYFAA